MELALHHRVFRTMLTMSYHSMCNVMFAQCMKVLLCMNNVSLRQPRLIQLSVSSVNQWNCKQADIFPVSLSARIRYMYWSMLISRYLLTISHMSWKIISRIYKFSHILIGLNIYVLIQDYFVIARPLNPPTPFLFFY